jgi:hypothetical protein
VQWLSPLLASAPAERLMLRRAGSLIPVMEAEVDALGSSLSERVSASDPTGVR